MKNFIVGIPTVKRTASPEEFGGRKAIILTPNSDKARGKVGFTHALCAELSLEEKDVMVNILVEMNDEGTKVVNTYLIPQHVDGIKLSNKIGRNLRTFSNKKVYDFILENVLGKEEISLDTELDIEINTKIGFPWAINLVGEYVELPSWATSEVLTYEEANTIPADISDFIDVEPDSILTGTDSTNNHFSEY